MNVMSVFCWYLNFQILSIFSGTDNIDEIRKYVGNVDSEKDEYGTTALMFAADEGNEWIEFELLNESLNDRSIYLGHREIVELLIEKGANVNAVREFM